MPTQVELETSRTTGLSAFAILSNAIDDKDIQAFTQVVHYHL